MRLQSSGDPFVRALVAILLDSLTHFSAAAHPASEMRRHHLVFVQSIEELFDRPANDRIAIEPQATFERRLKADFDLANERACGRILGTDDFNVEISQQLLEWLWMRAFEESRHGSIPPLTKRANANGHPH